MVTLSDGIHAIGALNPKVIELIRLIEAHLEGVGRD